MYRNQGTFDGRPPRERRCWPLIKLTLGQYRKLLASRCVRRLLRDREPPYALAGGGIDRIRDGRSHARRPGLAHSSRALRTLDNVDLDSGCLVDAQDLVVAEIGLFNAPILRGDFSVQGCRCSCGIQAVTSLLALICLPMAKRPHVGSSAASPITLRRQYPSLSRLVMYGIVQSNGLPQQPVKVRWRSPLSIATWKRQPKLS